MSPPKHPPSATTVDSGPGWLAPPDLDERDRQVLWGLVVAWSAEEPERVGELALIERACDFGRGEGEGPRASLSRQRPGVSRPVGALESAGISRRQLRLVPTAEGLNVQRVGRRAMCVGEDRVDAVTLRAGDVIRLEDRLVLLCVRRPRTLPVLRAWDIRAIPQFGRADAHGIVGESPAAWELRERIAFCAASDRHALVLGESGTGKELTARAMHALSRRGDGPWIARNAATIPESLIDAELFGHAKNFPNAGMPERPGLIGAADGGTLFLDELGELPEPQQSRLLRVLDSGGEHQRLGEAGVRRADVRLIAATNRDPAELKHDLLARLVLRLELPGLGERPEDVPLIARALLAGAREAHPGGLAPFLDEAGAPRLGPRLVEALLGHRFEHHVRELDALLWRSIETSRRGYLELTDAVRASLRPRETSSRSAEPSREELEAAIGAADGNVTRAARALGLSSRYALYRLMRKHGIER